jgi:hypothetical protein
MIIVMDAQFSCILYPSWAYGVVTPHFHLVCVKGLTRRCYG